MKYIEVGTSGIKASNLVMGCMRLKGKTPEEAENPDPYRHGRGDQLF